MRNKDYFRILELEPSAAVTDIKKAYRRLALRLHPDKSGNDPYATARFAEIKEAYEVLTDPAKKEYYLQQRWYNQCIGRRKTHDIITPVSILKQSLELERYVAGLDHFRMDREGLLQYMLELFNDECIGKLQQFAEPEIKKSIFQAILRAMKPLTAEQAAQVAERLRQLLPGDPYIENRLTAQLQLSRKSDLAEKWGFMVPLLLAIGLTLLIYLAAG